MKLHILIAVSFLIIGAYLMGNLLPSDPVVTSDKVSTLPTDKLTESKIPTSSAPSSSSPSQSPLTVKAQQESSSSSNSAINNSDLSSPSSSEISLPEIFKKTENSVVQITSTRPGSDQIVLNGREIPQNNIALGSGFVYDQEGRIITNHHVASEVDEVDVKFVDGDTYTAKVIGKDPYSDIGVLQITDRAFFDKKVAPLTIANSSEIEVGEQIIAIGNPFGLSGTLTTGVVSQIGRLLPNDITGYSIANTIQTDAAINPGN